MLNKGDHVRVQVGVLRGATGTVKAVEQSFGEVIYTLDLDRPTKDGQIAATSLREEHLTKA